MVIRKYKYTAEDVDCRFCVNFSRRRCQLGKCPWMKERIEAGVIGYAQAVEEALPEHSPLRARLKTAMPLYSRSFWKDESHQRRFSLAQAIFGYYRRRNTPGYYAAIYLFTADADLFRRTLDCVSRPGLDFDQADLIGISTENYALFKLAKCFYRQSGEVGVDELADGELFSTGNLRLAINAMLLARYGLPALSLIQGEF